MSWLKSRRSNGNDALKASTSGKRDALKRPRRRFLFMVARDTVAAGVFVLARDSILRRPFMVEESKVPE
jgi:hypothetical protein